MKTLARKLNGLVLCAAALLGGCITARDFDLASRDPIIPADSINVTRSMSVPLEAVAAGVAIYLILDPLAPNWQIKETRYEGGRYLIAMKKKRFTTGGDGEAVQIFNRRAAQIAAEQGGKNYQVIEYSEGVESNVLIAQRVAQGVVVVVK